MSDFLKLIGLSVTGTMALAAIGYVLGPPKAAKAPSGPRASPDLYGDPQMAEEEGGQTSQEQELMFQQLYQQLNEAIARRDLPLAEKRAEAFVTFAKGFGEQSINYGFVLGIPIASFHEMKGDFKAMEKCLREAVEILQPFGIEYVTDTGILEKLLNYYMTKGGDEYKKAQKYALTMVQWRKNQLKEKKNNETIEKFGQAANRAGLILSNMGSFKQAEALFKEALAVYQEIPTASPTVCICLEYYSNMLHQQGKTREAVAALETYKKKTEKQSDPKKTRLTIMRRVATLLFTIDEYEESIKYLNNVLQESGDPSTELLVLSELANSYWELKNEPEANKIQSQIRERQPIGFQLPFTRSKYLCTIECSVDRTGYTLVMRVNREPPNRKQGEALEDAPQLKRKLDKCFLEIQYQNPDGNLTTDTVMVTTPHEFTLKSPAVLIPFEAAKWYEATITIYKDKDAFESRTPLGIHHQLIYAFPPTAYVPRI